MTNPTLPEAPSAVPRPQSGGPPRHRSRPLQNAAPSAAPHSALRPAGLADDALPRHDRAAHENGRNGDRGVSSVSQGLAVLERVRVRRSSPQQKTLPSERLPRHVGSGPWYITPAGNRSFGYLLAKRALDIAVSLTVLVLAAPLLLAVLAILLVTTKGHPLFSQERVGYLGRRFRMFKFRTMVLNAEKLRAEISNEQEGPIFKNRTDPRITRIGRLLRKTSIDEMPQLVNVLLGDMSIIGPRPPLPHEVDQYAPLHRKRLAVTPGLTCLWQVSGRSDIGFRRWMQMDLWYVRNQDLLIDIGLLLRTPWAVLSRRGAH